MKHIVLLGNNNFSNGRELTILPESFEIQVEPYEDGIVNIDFMKDEACLYSTFIHLNKEDFIYFMDDAFENMEEDDLSDYLMRLIAKDFGYFINYEYQGDDDLDNLFGQYFINLREFTESWSTELSYEIRRRKKAEKDEIDKLWFGTYS